MKNIIRYSVFGNFDLFATSNVEKYMALIQFFSQKGYKPMTANELKLLPNGQAQVLVMPTFVKDNDILVEITSTRINFSLTSVDFMEKLLESFYAEMKELIVDFTSKFEVISNRIAINCNIETFLETTNESSKPIIADTTEMESHLRQCFRGKINTEECNIIIEKNNIIPLNVTRYSYDVNTIVENASLRFSSRDYIGMLDSMKELLLSIKKDSDHND